jgi:hypothetical protein
MNQWYVSGAWEDVWNGILQKLQNSRLQAIRISALLFSPVDAGVRTAPQWIEMD